ncbi:MAG: DUF5680 domain-containing protein [DPANN group archaeon]|nr:DUF5680 domain-containing protein [DPANN group archaeon]
MQTPLCFPDLADFLVRAKKESWAGNAQETRWWGIKSVEPFIAKAGSVTLCYIDNYADSGGNKFQGFEVVSRLDNGWQPVWAMSYKGQYLGADKEKEAVNDVLKQSLKAVPVDAPFRGPRIHKSGEYTYTNSYGGDIKEFHGVEEIVFRGKRVRSEEQVHELKYFGGLIK